VAAAVVNLTSRADCELGQLGKIIRADGVMTMRFLALANSAALSRGHEIRELRDALVRLGCRKIRNVALLMGMHDMQQDTDETCPLRSSEYWKYCLATAVCAENLAESRGTVSTDDAWQTGWALGFFVEASAAFNLWIGEIYGTLRYTNYRTDLGFRAIYDNALRLYEPTAPLEEESAEAETEAEATDPAPIPVAAPAPHPEPIPEPRSTPTPHDLD